MRKKLRGQEDGSGSGILWDNNLKLTVVTDSARLYATGGLPIAEWKSILPHHAPLALEAEGRNKHSAKAEMCQQGIPHTTMEYSGMYLWLDYGPFVAGL